VSRDRDWLIPVTIIVSVELALWAAAYLAGDAAKPMLVTYGLIAVSVFTLALGLRTLLFLYRSRPENPLRSVGQLFRSNLSRIVAALAGAGILALGSAAFGSLKAGIPLITPFWFDVPIASAEAPLFDGYLLGPATRWSVSFFDHLYGTFVLTHIIAVLVLLASAPSPLKTRALVSLALAWLVIGTLGAYALSSAGPIFFDRAYGSASFAQLDSMLSKNAPLSVMTANALWSAHVSGVPMFGNGISAMPSMHVALTLWLALLSHRTRFAVAGWLYYALIWTGSVLLGWHWFSDGLVGSLAMFAIWALCATTSSEADRAARVAVQSPAA